MQNCCLFQHSQVCVLVLTNRFKGYYRSIWHLQGIARKKIIFSLSLSLPPSLFLFHFSQVSVVNALDMQVVVSNVPPTVVEENKEQLVR